MKKLIILSMAFVLALSLFACSGRGNEGNDILTIDQIQNNPTSFLGQITVVGIVAPSESQDFNLRSQSGNFEIFVDYRGSQALPQVGEKIIIQGDFTENRSCCGPGFTLTSTGFELWEDSR